MPLDDPDVVFVVANSGIRHRNASGAYGERVQQCKDAVEAVSQSQNVVNKRLFLSLMAFSCLHRRRKTNLLALSHLESVKDRGSVRNIPGTFRV